MKNKDLISIIIPVYNTSKYLVRCLDSVLNQTHLNIEVIIIDDGSTDSSKEIISQYEKKDNRIKSIFTENHGVSHARNMGLDLANGDYIGFVDSDDYVDLKMYETLLDLIKKYQTDISMISFCRIKNNEIIENHDEKQIYCLNKEDFIKEYLILKKVKAHLTNKLFQRKLFEKVRFPENINYEDDAIFLQIADKVEQFVLYEKSMYYYCIREHSITTSTNLKPRQDFYDITYVNYDFIKTNYPKLNAYAAFYLIDSLVINYIYCLNNNIFSITNQIEKQIPLMNKLVLKYSKVIITELDPMKKCALFTMLWDLNFAKEYILNIWKFYIH
ncbi:MAG: glycosyltransferase [Bacilli bacterium]|nr:glycosyltransferase [Bacilli bacterium]